MPSIEQYLECNDEYRNNIIPNNVKKIIIEAGSSFGWHRVTKDNTYYITLEEFGVSASQKDVLDYMHFSYDEVKEKVFKIMNIKNSKTE